MMSGKRAGNVRLAVFAVLGTCLPYAPVLGQATFHGLGDLPGGIEGSAGFGVSGDGTAVVGGGNFAFIPGEPGAQAFRWSASEGMIGLGHLPNFTTGSYAYACSANGAVVVGGSWSITSSQAFMWTAGDGMLGLGDLPGGNFNSAAFGTSADGRVIVGSSSAANGSQAFRWTPAGGMVGLGLLPGGNYSEAGSVSADGSTVVGYSSGAAWTEAFRWTTTGGMVGLGDLPGGDLGSVATAISADGRIVVGGGTSGSDVTQAVRWDETGVPHGLGDLPGSKVFSHAYDVSGDGSIVVGHGLSDLGDEAFIWDAQHGMRSLQSVLVNDFGLNLDGWQLVYAMSVSDNGRTITGFGANPTGGVEAWVATIPEPGTAALLLIALLGRRAVASRRFRYW